jgi:lipoate-protein ligase A
LLSRINHANVAEILLKIKDQINDKTFSSIKKILAVNNEAPEEYKIQRIAFKEFRQLEESKGDIIEEQEEEKKERKGNSIAKT